ncbi:MAG: DUF456 domain-containing protein [Nesterenkonia sp.]|uniref:DUF456 domain-containing protein n=1 Tax=Nesterenkonia marinintestina TaxID=2979865 RepID=UPI0021C1745E|nr:DUF456 domain-containing protein [Nesterenkonia sp. GX14115]MDO5492965.1 DUF456 domain-containing protein [Nesterenkonia sp.]
MLESSVSEGLVSGVALVLLIVGAAGVILPVLPGSLLIILTLAAWAVLLGSGPAWIAALLGIVLAVVGWSAATVLTGRVLRREQIPRGPILIAILVGLVGMVVLPPLGLFLGFAAGLFGAEYVRRDRDHRAALYASLSALRAVGLGILVEFGLAGAAVSCFVIGALIHHFA